MKDLKITASIASLVTALIFAPMASAHVSVQTKLYANSYSQIELAVPHGCEGFDTVKVEVSLPEGLTGIRPLDSVFGAAEINLDDEGAITSITWQAQKAMPYATDSHAYSLLFRAKTPDDTFKILHFPTVQTCEDPDGNIYTSEWVGMDSGHDHNAESDILPAPSALLHPKAAPGWHQFTAQDHMHDMSIFNDAEIVWKGDAAYSANTYTATMIEDDLAVSTLSEIHPGEMFWVKY